MSENKVDPQYERRVSKNFEELKFDLVHSMGNSGYAYKYRDSQQKQLRSQQCNAQDNDYYDLYNIPRSENTPIQMQSDGENVSFGSEYASNSQGGGSIDAQVGFPQT